MRDLSLQEAIHNSFATWVALIGIIVSILTSVVGNQITAWLNREHLTIKAPLPGRRLFGYLISTALAAAGLLIASVSFGSPLGAALVVVFATLLIGFPMTLLLDRFQWMRTRFGGDTVLDSISMDLLGFVYSLFVLAILGLTLQSAFK